MTDTNRQNDNGKEEVKSVFPKITLESTMPSDALIEQTAEQYKGAFAGNSADITALEGFLSAQAQLGNTTGPIVDAIKKQLAALQGDESDAKRKKMLDLLRANVSMTVEPLGIYLVPVDVHKHLCGEQVREGVESLLAILEHSDDLDSIKSGILLGLARKMGAILTTLDGDHGEVIVREKQRKSSGNTGGAGTGRGRSANAHNFLTISSEAKFLSAPASVRQAASRAIVGGTDFDSGNAAVLALGLEKNSSSAKAQLAPYGLVIVAAPADWQQYRQLLEANVANGTQAA